MGKKILVISIKAGYGHVKAGEAIMEYARKNCPELKIAHVDICDIDPYLGKFFQNFYNITSIHFPGVWRKVYAAFNKELIALFVHKAIELQSALNYRMTHYLKQQKADGIIFTNPVSAPVVAPVCREIFPEAILGVVVTDYHGHLYYNVKAIDRYFVAMPEVKNELAVAGVREDKITVTGIPVSSRFCQIKNSEKLKKRLVFDPKSKTVLFINRLEKDFFVPVIEELLMRQPRVNLVVVTGGNEKLYRRVKAEFSDNFPNLRIINWTNRMDEYMRIADVVISKPGGLIISECLALRKPIVMTDPIPGQEEQNAAFIAKHDYGILALTGGEIVGGVNKYLGENPEYAILPEAANACGEILKYFR